MNKVYWQCIYPLFKTVYTQTCIYPFFSPKSVYTHRIHISENDLLEFCFFFYFLFSPPQAPPNAIFQRLIQFPFISDASRQDLTRYSSEIPNIHIPKTAQKCIYTKIYIHIFFSEKSIYTSHVYMCLSI